MTIGNIGFKHMKIQDKYLETLKSMGDWITISEWATRVAEVYPDMLEKAEEQAANQVQDTTGLREIGARISSATSAGIFDGQIEVDTSERPRRVRFVTADDLAKHAAIEAEDDVAPLKREEIEKRDFEKLTSVERYRLEEFQSISRQLKSFYGFEFELDHAAALLNEEMPGAHCPDNMQFLLKRHNRKKQNSNWPRFTLDEQIAYIRSAVELQKLVIERLGLEDQTDVVDALLERIAKVYD